jgi:hypothetical protein
MAENRIDELLRDPTLESPTLDYYELRVQGGAFPVTRRSAERVLEALIGFERADWVRIETVSGSVLYLKTEAVVWVREWSRQQRDTNRRFWKEIDKEDEEDEDGESGTDAGGSSTKKRGGGASPVTTSVDARVILLETNLRWLVAIVLSMIVLGLLG